MPLGYDSPEESRNQDVVSKTESGRYAGANSGGSHAARDAQLRGRIPIQQNANHLPHASHLQTRHKPGGYIKAETEQPKGTNERAVTRSQKMGTNVSVEVNSGKTVDELEPDAQYKDYPSISQLATENRAPSHNGSVLTEQRRAEHLGPLVGSFNEVQTTRLNGVEWTNRAIYRLKNRLNQMHRQMATQKSKYDKTSQQLISSRNELARSEATIALLNKSLEDCKERIVAMQPEQGMSDNQLLDLYRSMNEGIEEWVESCCGDVDDTIVFMVKSQAFDMGNSGVWILFSEDDLQNILHHKSIDKPMLASFVFRILYDQILHEKCSMIGLDPDSEFTLNCLSESITRLQPPKDIENCQMWKMNMHRALRASNGMKDVEKAGVRQVTRKILHCLEFVVPETIQTQEMQHELHKIVSMAADLAANIRINMAKYSFEFPLDTQSGIEKRVMMMDGLKNYSIIDCNTGLPLRASSKILADQNGRVGEKLSWIFPGLVRRDIRQDKRTELCKPVIVVQFDHEIPRGGKPKAFV